ncbi:hypothetical protein K1719_024383 [Acacia pycnantha]|nr:hypothetical protein K1719_024383 [Acacia pycnantha]
MNLQLRFPSIQADEIEVKRTFDGRSHRLQSKREKNNFPSLTFTQQETSTANEWLEWTYQRILSRVFDPFSDGAAGGLTENSEKRFWARSFAIIGGCYSAGIKSENSSRKAVNLTHDGKEEDGSIGGSNKVSQLKIFTYNELKAATRNFHPDYKVAEGSFGSVFKGWLDEQTLAPAKPGTGIAIAVKKLKKDVFQGDKEWLVRQINFLGQLHHPNLMKLIGYCLGDQHRLLVHEFLTKGSLDNYLFQRTCHGEPLSWSNRMKIALDAAKAIAFVHTDEVNVKNRNLKASRILLDSNFNPKLSYFVLAKDRPLGVNHTKCMAPEFGYMAPESAASGKCAWDCKRPGRERNLVVWAKPYLSSKRGIFQVMDARIEGQYEVHEAMKVAKIAIQCLSESKRLRPTMADVVSALEQLQDSSLMQVAQSSSNISVPN